MLDTHSSLYQHNIAFCKIAQKLLQEQCSRWKRARFAAAGEIGQCFRVF